MSEPAPARATQGCKYHPPLPAKVNCRQCGAPLCSLCCKFVDGKFLCEECVNASVARKLSLSSESGRRQFMDTRLVSGFHDKAIPPEAYIDAPVALPESTETEAPPAPMPQRPASSLNFLPTDKGLPVAPPPRSRSTASIRLDGVPARPSTAGHKTAFSANSPELQERLARHREEIAARQYSCKNHPGVAGNKKCDLCGGVFCGDCVKEVRKRLLCRDCARPGGRTALIARPAVIEQPRTLAALLPHAFLYPLLGERKYLLLAAPPLLWLSFIGHWGAGVAVMVVIALWLMKIALRTAQNADDQSTHPAIEEASHDIVKPFFHILLALFVLALPILIYVPLGNPDLMYRTIDYLGLTLSGDEAAEAQRAKDPDHAFRVVSDRVRIDKVIPWLLLGALLMLPLALGMVGLFGRADVLSPPTLLSAATHLGGLYALMLALLAAGFVPSWYMLMYLEDFSSILGLISSFLMVYFSIVGMRYFGLIYFTNKAVFDWYGRPLAER